MPNSERISDMANNANLLPGGKKGNKGGSGRPPDEFKKKMLVLSDSPAAWKFRKDVIEGNPIEERMLLDPISGLEKKVLVTASIENRRRMLADIDDRAHGKAVQMVDTPNEGELARMLIMRPPELPKIEYAHTIVRSPDHNENGHNGSGSKLA